MIRGQTMAARVRFFSFRPYLTFIIHRPLYALFAVGMVTGMLAWQLPHLSFKTAVYDLIIQELPEAIEYRDFRNIFGSDEMVRIVIRSDNVFSPFTFAKMTELSQAALKIDGVRRVLSLPEIKANVDPRSEWSMDQFAAMLEPVDLFKRNLISADRQSAIITLVLSRDADKDAVISAVRKLIQNSPKNIQLYQIGIPLVSEALAHYASVDFWHLTPITLGVIIILLVILFRSFHCLLLPVACVSLSTLWTFGYMAFRGVPVSMLTIIVPVFIIAVGTAYCLHLCSTYQSLAQQETTAKAATEATFSKMAFPVTLAVLTTLLGIGSLAINRIAAIKAFAEFACFGIAALWMLVLVFLPAASALLPLPKRSPSRRASGLDRFFDQAIEWIIHLNLHCQKVCLTTIGVVAGICVLGLFFIRVETNPLSYFKPDAPVRRNFHDIYQKMSGSFPLHVVLRGDLDDYFEEPANVVQIAKLQTFLASLDGVDKTVSFADYLKLVNYIYNRFDSKYYVLPEDLYEMRMLVNNFKGLLGNDMLQAFMSPDMRQANILLLTHISSSRQFMETKKTILDHVALDFAPNLSASVTGLGVVMAASSQLLTIGQVKSLSLSLVLIFGVMVALFLSAKVGLIAVVPNVFPILVNFGLMGLLGIPLSVATSLIASVAIGLAVDDTIHYLVRYNSEFKKDLDKDRAMRTTLVAVGRPIIFTSMTIGLGFSVLLFSHFQPTATFGLLMMITMFSALVGDLLLLPTLMMHVELVTAWDLLKMMPTMGGMSAGMVHELNQPLNAIKVGNDVIRMMVRKGGKLDGDRLNYVTDEIRRQVGRASQMIERFQDIGNLPEFEKTLLSINKPIRNTVETLSHQLKLDNIDIACDLAEALPQVKAHYNRLVQVVFNIMTNARESIMMQQQSGAPTGGHKIMLRTYAAGNAVVVTITDTGRGFDNRTLDRVFEPFFTTKKTGQGKGLGLTICRQIMRDCNGTVTVANGETAGAVVTLRFPAALDE